MKNKIIALHLPQYHEIEENNEWWGKGFTDWVNVKKAKPLYEWHKQPIEPLDDYYYDMDSIETLSWQAKLAEKYGIYGFCYYHYWFNGKLLLERPCELLLNSKEVNEKYCFCWANESWIRTWEVDSRKVLMQQKYGENSDWLNHIKYLARFFKDERYIRHDNRPVLFVYSLAAIENWDKMLTVWNDYLSSIGVPELYIVEFITASNDGSAKRNSDAVCEFQPHCVARYNISVMHILKRIICKKLGRPDILDYDYLWKRLLANKRKYKKPIIRSAFVSFDNTARKMNRAMITKGASPIKFGKYISQLADDKSRDYVDDYIVINAWNEWAEGAVLEPSKEWEFGYLEALENLQKR